MEITMKGWCLTETVVRFQNYGGKSLGLCQQEVWSEQDQGHPQITVLLTQRLQELIKVYL